MDDHAGLVPELYRLLTHLNDPSFLENHPLAARLNPAAQAPGLSRGQALRQTLRLAIAALDPGIDSSSSALEPRPYRVLYRYAISRQSMLAIADHLGISRRQAYRELRCAVEALARIVSGSLVDWPPAPAPGATLAVADVRAELERLAWIADEDVDVREVVADVVESARRLAQQRGIVVELGQEPLPFHAATNRVMLRQALLNLLSHAVSVSGRSGILVEMVRSGESASVRLTYRAQAASVACRPQDPYAVATQLFDALGMNVKRSLTRAGAIQITVDIPVLEEHTVLIIDDNEGLIQLFRRFLRDQPYVVHGATSAEPALEVMERVRPDVVLLDVMMPGCDGWEMLERLRAHQAGRRARVVVCSIINDPDLAAALGADAFLLKPVERSKLLHTLCAVLSSRR